MAFGGGSMVLDENLVPADVAQRVKAKEDEIMDGLFRVNVNDAARNPTINRSNWAGVSSRPAFHDS